MRLFVLASLGLTVLGACLEVWFIAYASRLLDMLAGVESSTFFQAHRRELILAAALILIVRPLLAALREELDDIAFRPDARIAEIGSHDDLLRSNGLNASLWNRQTCGYLG